MKERYHISGMTCSACSAHVERAVSKLEGVEKVSVNLLAETMEISYEEGRLDREDIQEAVEKAGYGASPIIGGAYTRSGSSGGTGGLQGAAGNPEEGGESVRSAGGHVRSTGENMRSAGGSGQRGGLQRRAREEARAMKLRLGISIVFLLPLMYVAMYHMYNEWFGIPVPSFVHAYFHGNENAMTFAMTQFLLLLPILYVNRKFFSVGFRTLRHLSPNMDSLIALGASAAVGYGVFAMYRISYGLGHGDLALVE